MPLSQRINSQHSRTEKSPRLQQSPSQWIDESREKAVGNCHTGFGASVVMSNGQNVLDMSLLAESFLNDADSETRCLKISSLIGCELLFTCIQTSKHLALKNLVLFIENKHDTLSVSDKHMQACKVVQPEEGFASGSRV